MAEEYYVGRRRRIVYKSGAFKSDLEVSVDMYCPNGKKCGDSRFQLIEIGDGLYYFNFNFTNKGMYTGIFYENGVKSIAQNFRAVIEPFYGLGGRIINGDKLI